MALVMAKTATPGLDKVVLTQGEPCLIAKKNAPWLGEILLSPIFSRVTPVSPR